MKNNSPIINKFLLSAIAAASIAGSANVHAQATWTSTTTGGDWATGPWTGTAPTTNGTSALTFDTASANRTYTNTLTNLTVSSLTVTSTSRDNNVTGNAINLAGGITDSTTSWQTFNIDMALGNAARTINVTAGRLYLGGVLSGTGSAGANAAITKTGGADLWLTNANTITGNGTNTVNSTIAGAGTYNQALLFSGSLPNSPSGTVVLNNTAALGASTNSVRFSGGGSGVLDLQTDTSVNAYSIFSGSGNGGTINVGRATAGAGITHVLGALDLSSVGMTINTGSNVTSGTAGVSFTSLSMSGGNDNNPVTIAGSAAISIGTAGITNNTGTTRRLQLDGTNGGNTIGVISNIAPGASGAALINLIKANSSTWTLTANNTYTGTTTISGGTLQLGNGSLTGALSSGSAITNNATLAINRSNTVTQGTDFASTISGTGVFTKNGTGNLILSGANVGTGSVRDVLTFINPTSGTVTLTNTSALGAAGNTIRFGATTFSGTSGTLDLQTDTSVNAYGITSGTGNGGTITVNRATAGAGITHALGILNLSSVTLTANTGSNVTSGTAGLSFTELQMGGGNDFNPVTLAGSASYTIGSASITANGQPKRLQLDGTSALNSIGAITNTNNATAGAIVNVIKANSSTWTLTGTNTYTGTTTINGGTLKAGTTSAFGSNSAVTLADTAGVVLDLNNNANSIGSLTGGGTTGGNVTLGNATLTVGGDNTSPAAFAGVISGTGALTKTGTGQLTLSNKNTFEGGTVINNGTLELNTNGQSGTGAIRGTVTVNTGAVLSSTAADSFGYNTNTKVNTLNIVGGTVTHNAGGNLTISSATVNMTAGTLQSTGSGVLDIYNNGSGQTTINTLASANTATIAGAIGLRSGDNITSPDTVFAVANGAAAVDLNVTAIVANGQFNSANSSIQKSGAGLMRLTGSNTYDGNTTVNSGTLELANSSGSAAGSTSSVKVLTTGTLLLSNSDQINNSASVSLGGGTIKFGAAVTEGSTSAVGVGALTLTASSTIDFSNFASTLTFSSFAPSSFTLNVTNWTPSSSRLIFNADQSSNLSSFTVNSLAASQIDLGGGFYEITAVPEPGTIVGGIALLGCVGLVERKRIGRLFSSSSSRAIC